MATPAASKDILQPIEPREITPRRMRAHLRLQFSRNSETGETFLSESYQEPPLKVVRAFPLPDGAALAHLHNISGGLLGGDHLTQEINLESRTRVQLTTTGATRVYRHCSGGLPTTQSNEIVVGEGAQLEYLPDATIPFAGARFHQHTSIRLESGAGLFWWEILAPGREARGELFGYDELAVKTRISALRKTIAAENLLFSPASAEVSSLARLGPYRYLATFYICHVGLVARRWRTAEDYLREITCSLTRSGETLWGISTLVSHGLVVRCLARNGREVLPGLHAIWRSAKRHLYDQDAIPPRKVN